MTRRLLTTLALLLAPAVAAAQTVPGVAGEALPGQGSATPATSTVTGKAVKVNQVLTLCGSGGNYVVCPVGSGGGGGGGDASAANQTTQITAEQAIRDRIGDTVASPAAYTMQSRLAAIAAKQPTLDTNGDMRVPTVTVASFYVSLSANTSTTVLAPSATRIGYDIQCAGTAAVGLSRVGASLTSATPSAGGADLVIPAGTTPYFQPAYVSGSAVTAYSTAAQACWGVSYARQ